MAQVKSLRTGIKFKDTPIGKIPVDWEVATLESISNDIYRYPTYYNIKYVEQKNGFPEVRGELIKDNGELSDNLSDYRFISKETSSQFPRTILHEGDFVISVRGTLGKIGYVSAKLEGANMTANLIRVSPKHDQAFPLWLKQILLSDIFQKKLHEASSATTIKTITAPELKGLNMPLPPLPEQKKIAEILTTVDDAIEETDRIIEKARELKKGLMQKLLTRGIRHKKFKKTEIGEIPVEWKVTKLNEVAKEFYNGGTPDTKVKEYWDGDIPWVTGADFINQRIDKIRRYITIEGVKNSATNVIPKGNLLVVTRTGVGKLAIAPFDIAISQDITGVITDTKRLLPDFLYRFLDYHEKKLKSFVQGTSINGLLREDLASLNICLPPLKEQGEIAEILTTVDIEIEYEENKKQSLKTLQKSLMQVLLTGRVRIKLH